ITAAKFGERTSSFISVTGVERIGEKGDQIVHGLRFEHGSIFPRIKPLRVAARDSLLRGSSANGSRAYRGPVSGPTARPTAAGFIRGASGNGEFSACRPVVCKKTIIGGDGENSGIALEKTGKKNIACGLAGFDSRIDGMLDGCSAGLRVQIGGAIHECGNSWVCLRIQLGHQLWVFR